MDLGTMVDAIQNNESVLRKHGYKWIAGGGIKPWSHRYINGDNKIDVRASEWTLYDKDDKEIKTGRNAAELDFYLCGSLEFAI